MTTTLTFDPEQLATYRHTAQKRRQQEQSALQQRYRRARHVAEQASRLLCERFGAQRIAAFGSLLRPELFHAQSDVDLAVWGLPEQAFDKAQAALMAIDPQIAVDLLNMDTATGGLRDAIEHDTGLYDREEALMKGDDVGSHLLQGGQEVALAARIRSELADVGQAVERAERLLAKAKSSGDNDWLDGVALNLHSFYTGVEKFFEEIVKEIDGGLPTGAEWHQKLLVQVALKSQSDDPL